MNGFSESQDNYGRPGCTEWVECEDCTICFESEGESVCWGCQHDRENPTDPKFTAALIAATKAVK